MKAVIQRVQHASITVDGKTVAEIGPGVLTLLGLEHKDDTQGLSKLISKIVELRIFSDSAGKMNLSLKDTNGAHLIVSQFTLAGDCSSGRRPSFTTAMKPELAKPLWERAIELSTAAGVKTAGGIFQADMKVALVNDGPVTFILEA
jgi:D-tyrosyl-tRNA(Tyr) deacylase